MVIGQPKKCSVCASKARNNKLLGGISRDFWWGITGVPEKFEKKKLVLYFSEGRNGGLPKGA